MQSRRFFSRPLPRLIISISVLVSLADVGGAECNELGLHAIESLVTRWRWEKFWQNGIGSANYIEGRAVVLRLFWTPNALGYCIADLHRCASYARLGETWSLGEMLASSNESRIPRNFVARWSPNAVNWDTSAPTYCETQLVLPALPPPDAVLRHTIPNSYSALKKQLVAQQRELFSAIHVRLELVIPFYSDKDPQIYILSKRQAQSDSILLLIHNDARIGWRVGGHFGDDFSPENVPKYARIISAIKMSSIVTK